MKQLKQVATTLKQLGISVDPRVWIVLGIAVSVLVAVVAWVKLRRKKKEEAAAAPEAGIEAAAARPAPPPAAAQLWGVWQRFLKQLPRLYRRSILRFQPFVVLGAAGAGKSQVIETYTDWRRQELQFLGSSLEDPNLQIYLGSHALVLELPAPLTLDTSSHARRRLLKLFKPLFRKRQPTAVVVVDLARLTSSAPDAVRAQADMVRGKLNLLAEAHKGPIELRVVLTRVDQVSGFEDFARFLDAQGLPAVIQMEPGAEHEYAVEGALQESFGQFDRLLPLALTTVPSESYLRIISFLREMPARLAALNGYLPALVSTDALGRRPNLERIYLASTASSTAPTTGRAANPFHPIASDADALPTPLRWHRMAAGVAALVGVAFFSWSYFHERALWRPAQTAMFAYTADKDPAREKKLRAEVISFRRHEEQDALLRVAPSFFHHGSEQLDLELARAIRDRYLLPGLDRSLGSDFGPRQSLYYLALIYATRTNSLGKVVLAHSEDWAEATGLDRTLIEDYIDSARLPYERKVSLEGLPHQAQRGAANDAQPWILYFLRVQRAMDGGAASPEELTELKTRATELLQAATVVERFEQAPTVLRELDTNTGYGFEAVYAPYLQDVQSRTLFGSTLPDLKGILTRIAQTQVDPVVVPEALLVDLCARLRLIIDDHGEGTPPTFDLRFGDQRFTIKAADWDTLVRRSAARAQVIAFVHDGDLAKGKHSIFFDGKDDDIAVMMNPGTNGQFLFTGKATLNSRYTRATFDRSVRPVVFEFNELLGKLALGPNEQRMLEAFVYRQMEEYAAQYAEAIDRYYRAYGVNAQSAEAVQLLIKQMLRPDSPFMELLRVIAANTQLDVDAGKVHLFQPMVDALGKYEPVGRLTASDGPGPQQLAKYAGILQLLLTSLHPDAAAPAKDAAGGSEAEAGAAAAPAAPPITQLADMLSPTGKVGLAILQEQKGSYWELVHGWLADVGIPPELAGPFLDPVRQLYEVALRELHDAVTDAWQHQVLTALGGVVDAFPFDPDSTKDARPEDLIALFDPKSGKFQDLRRRFVEPISQHLPSGWTAKAGAGRVVRTPPGMYALLDNVDRLSAQLWDAEGKPQPLHLRVSPVPFSASESKRDALTLVYLSSGPSSIFNFNQQPAPQTVELDWTRAKRAQVGVELTNTITGEKTYPPAIVSSASPWALVHLLTEGTRDGHSWLWVFRYGKNNELVTGVSFVIQPDPWKLFTLLPADTADRRASREP